ncbi:Non-specific serine/threonine protein kinase [Mycena venus]|uniref:Non-specific serine/threonine protein kinase n=1 Tax=Mycena venus TaxID=2733690 RepID=A0A8H6X576_9AGAR|nr:Non-specific serine/threonine protein kinase [Mycena venus]
MSFTYQLRVGGSYSLDTHIRLQPPFKVRVMKSTKNKTAISSAEKDQGGKGQQVSPLYSMEAKTGVVIRQGAVRVKECGTVHPRNWFFRMKWLVLCEKQLALHPSQNSKAPTTSILLANIDKLERTDRIPRGLSLRTKDGRRYLLSFEKDSDLYDLQDDISRHSMGVGLPYNFVHETHAIFDVRAGAAIGLPVGWDEVFNLRSTTVSSDNSSPAEPEPQASLVIKIPTSKLEYVWRVRSLTENLEDILQAVCHNMGLRAVESVLTLAGDRTPLTGNVADLQGKRELEIISRAPVEAVSPPPANEQIFLRVRMLIRSCDIHISTTLAVTRRAEIRDVLQAVCRKMKLEAPQHVLKLADSVEPLAMDATVDDLGGKRNLILTQDPLAMDEEPPLPINLRISVDGTYLCSLSVAPQMKIQDVLERICWKFQYQAPKYILSIVGNVEPLAMDQIVADLEGEHDLVLTNRDDSEVTTADKTVLRVNLLIYPDETFLGSVSATPQMQIQDVLCRICLKMRLRASDYTLAFTGSMEPLATDLTVAGLGGKHELVLIKRTCRAFSGFGHERPNNEESLEHAIFGSAQ